MFRRPSSRRKSENQEINVNLVPMLDALVTLVAFLLLSMAFIHIVVIDTPAPLLAPADKQKEDIKDKKPPLQLTAHIQEKQILISDWVGSRENHVIPSRPNDAGELQYDLEKLHQTLLEIQNRHPHETKLILKPDAGVSYESIVDIMDAARFLEKTDPPMLKKDKDGKPVRDEATGSDVYETDLFPEVIFGNILS